MEIKTAPIPNPFTNPHPKHLFCTDAKRIAAHRRLIESEAWQTGIVSAQMAMVRDLCISASNNLSDPNYQQAAALAFARIQGANDLVNIFSNLGEMPQPPKPKPSHDNLEPLEN